MEAKQLPSSRFAGALLPQSSSSKPGAKKLVIKQYAEKPKLPETFDADTWRRLSDAVAALLQHMPASHSFEELCAAPAAAATLLLLPPGSFLFFTHYLVQLQRLRGPLQPGGQSHGRHARAPERPRGCVR
jgi:hypothetical protein